MAAVKPSLGTDALAEALASRRNAAPQPPAAPAAEQQSPPAPAKKATTKRAATKKVAAPKAPTTPPATAPATPPVVEPEEVEEVDPLAGLRRDEQPMKVQLGQRVSAETARRFRRFCAVQGLNQGDFLDLALREALDRYSQ